MSITETSLKHLNNHFSTDYLPAVLREYKSGWLIEYYVEHPIEHKMVRKIQKVNRILNRYGSKIKARPHINKIVAKLNVKLAGGWNPLFHSDNARLYTTVNDVFDNFIKERGKELRDSTMEAYNDFGKHFLHYINEYYPDTFASMVTKIICIRWLDDMYIERNFGPYRYNNFVKMGRAFFNWAKEKCYIKDNPFDTIKLKQKPQKQREIINKDDRTKIVEYLIKQNPAVITMLKLCYNCLIRPNEIRQIRIENVDFNNKTIVIRSDVAKNKKQRIVSMTNDVYYELMRMNLQRFNPKWFLFSHQFNPDSTAVHRFYYAKYWAKIRENLGLPATMQLYSLRDTGIFDMLKAGIDDLSIMQHADHHSLEMTTIYANHADPHLADIIREKSPVF